MSPKSAGPPRPLHFVVTVSLSNPSTQLQHSAINLCFDYPKQNPPQKNKKLAVRKPIDSSSHKITSGATSDPDYDNVCGLKTFGWLDAQRAEFLRLTVLEQWGPVNIGNRGRFTENQKPLLSFKRVKYK
jgi:hypothetical protein